MNHSEVLSIVREAKNKKPYARVNFPYCVDDIERILHRKFSDFDRSKINEFYEIAAFYASFENQAYRYNPLYPVILSMCDNKDYFTLQELDVLFRSLKEVDGCKEAVIEYTRPIYFDWNDSVLDYWIETKEAEFLFEVNVKQLRRSVSLSNLFSENLTHIELKPIYVYKPVITTSVKNEHSESFIPN